MDTSSRRSGRSDSAPGWRRISLTLLAASLAFCLALAALLGEATGALAMLPGAALQAPVAQAQANATGGPGQLGGPTPTPTTPPPTATPPPATPTLVLISPTSKEGPVGAHITLGGAHWGSGSTVTISAITGGACQVTPSGQSLTTTQATDSGGLHVAFLWPSSLGSTGTTYIICASNGAATASGIPYTVLSSAPPTISLSVSSVQVGSVVSISGSNFSGAQSVIVSSENTSSVLHKIATVGVGSDGSFVTQFSPAADDAGVLTISAATPAQNGATPALQATAQLTVQAAATPTVTTTVAPTATAAAGGGGNTQSNSSGPSLGLLIVLVVAILLVVLLIIGLIVLVAMRRRRGAGPQGPGAAYGQGEYGPYGGPGGYGATGRQSAYGQYGQYGQSSANGPTGRYGAMGGQPVQDGQYGQYGRVGVYNNQGAQGDPYAPTVPSYADPVIGGVAQWDAGEADPEPDPNWRPSLMTGGRRYPDDFDDGANDASDDSIAYPDLPPLPGQQLPPGATNAPDDPWGDASGGFIPGGAYRPPANRHGATGDDPPIYGGMPPRSSGRYEAANSQGSTRPTGPTVGMPPSLYPPRNPQRPSGGPAGGPAGGERPGAQGRQRPADPEGWDNGGADGW